MSALHIGTIQKIADDEKRRATGLLQHYMLHLHGKTDPGCFYEVESITEHIVNAAVAQVKIELLKEANND